MSRVQEHAANVLRKAIDLTTAAQLCEANLGLLDELSIDPFPSFEEVFPGRPPQRPQRRVLAPPSAPPPAIPAPPTTNYGFGSYLASHAAPFVLCAAIVVPAQIGLFFNPTSFGLSLLSTVGTFGALVALLVCGFGYHKTRAQINASYQSSPAYRQAVDAALQEARRRQDALEEQAAQRQAHLDEEHRKALNVYETEIAPAYEQKRAEERKEYEALKRQYEQDKLQWEQKKRRAQEMLESDLLNNKAELEHLYASTKLISVHYRELWILQWLYDDMSTSDHDIRYATELLDRERQRLATETVAVKECEAIESLASSLGQLANVQLEGLAYLGSLVSDIRALNEKGYKINEKILFHQRVNTLDIAVDIWQRHRMR